jgi:Na+/phosphate symporter
MAKFGASIKGVITLGGLSILDPDALTGEYKIDALTYGTKMFTYSSNRKLTGTGFATAGFGVMMFAWQMMNEATAGGKLDVKKMVAAIKNTDGHRAFGVLSMNCKKALAPYIGVCATEVSASIWDGSSLKADKTHQGFTGLGLVGKGDPLRLTELK